MPPDQAWSVNSVAGLSLQGPSSPKGVSDVTTRCGWVRATWRGSSDGCAANDEPRDHTTASAESKSACNASSPAASEPSITTLRLEAPRKLKSAPSSSMGIAAPEADHRRNGSPSDDSTFVTSAPPSARSFVQ